MPGFGRYDTNAGMEQANIPSMASAVAWRRHEKKRVPAPGYHRRPHQVHESTMKWIPFLPGSHKNEFRFLLLNTDSRSRAPGAPPGYRATLNM